MVSNQYTAVIITESVEGPVELHVFLTGTEVYVYSLK